MVTRSEGKHLQDQRQFRVHGRNRTVLGECRPRGGVAKVRMRQRSGGHGWSGDAPRRCPQAGGVVPKANREAPHFRCCGCPTLATHLFLSPGWDTSNRDSPKCIVLFERSRRICVLLLSPFLTPAQNAGAPYHSSLFASSPSSVHRSLSTVLSGIVSACPN